MLESMVESVRHIRSSRSLKEWLTDAFQRKDTLLVMLWRDLKIQYGHPLLGILWSIAQPVSFLTVILVIHRFTGNMPIDADNANPVRLFAGLIVWAFLTSAVNGAASNIHSNSSLISKVYFPRIFLVLSPLLRSLCDLGIALAILVIITIATIGLPDYSAFWRIPISIFILLFSVMGISMLAGVAVVLNRHVRQAIPMLLYLGVFVFPVFVHLDGVENPVIKMVYESNPIAYAMKLLRSSISGEPADGLWIAFSFCAGLVLMGITAFRWLEKSLADRV